MSRRRWNWIRVEREIDFKGAPHGYRQIGDNLCKCSDCQRTSVAGFREIAESLSLDGRTVKDAAK